MDNQKLQELITRARSNMLAQEKQAEADAATALSLQVSQADSVDTSKLGITDELLKTDEGKDQATDIISDVIANAVKAKESYSSSSVSNETNENSPSSTGSGNKLGVSRDDITLNEKQQEACDRVNAGEDVVIIGAAGTGKTTSMRETTKSLVKGGRIKPLREGTKWLQAGSPGGAILSYTRKAVNVIRHAVADEFKPHTLTIHKILEFAPVWYEIEDPEKPGTFKKTMRFEPTRTRLNPLPPDLVFLGFEESSMISAELYDMLQDAMPHKHQHIYLGDIQQLPPIFGLAILGFKMLELPVIELTEVYRQALESPIISLAWKILEGNPHVFSSRKEDYTAYSPVLKKDVKRFRCPELEKFNIKNETGEVKLQIWQKQLSTDDGLNTTVKQFNAWADSNYYNPEEDMILCPYNKAFGTVEINKGISQYLGRKRDATVFEVIAGFNKHYLAVGDRVLYDKEDAFIVDIAMNSEYLGKRPQPASKNLDRWGHLQEALSEEEKLQTQVEEGEMDLAAIEKFMTATIEQAEERVQVASHVVTIKFAYEDETLEIEKAADINNMLGGYAITVHKAQGSEWKRVFFVMHNSHAVMNQRELLYTAVTRASKFLHIIAEPFTFEKGIKSQRIKGNTLTEKAEFFKGKESDYIKKKDLLEPAGEFRACEYKGKTPTPIVMKEPEKPAPKLVKLHEFVPPLIKKEAQKNLETYWQRAQLIWGSDKIGTMPVLDYNLQFHNKLGTANSKAGVIKLNPVWCCIAQDNPAVHKEMLEITLKHEVCHIVADRYSEERGHNAGWRMVMQLMGEKPEVFYDDNTLPSWTRSYAEVIMAKQQELAAAGGDFAEDTETNPDEES